ncbi:NFACT RNA binding domain-containing protein [Roseivirga pacifica]|uniref:NFACT RNA binding domain-containing protein n=1 Tax=Roseivirga pacifica TaxID=1267423 RepID=UPI003BABCFBB
MLFNYYTLKRLTAQLTPKLEGARWIESFTQSKNELIIALKLSNGQPFYIRCTLLPELSTLSFPKEFHKSRKNTAELFTSLREQSVTGLKQFLNERAFALHFSNGHTLLFKLHGNRGNIVLFKDQQVHELFRNKLAKDYELELATLDREIDQSKEAFLSSEQLSQVFPTFGKEVTAYLNEHNFHEIDKSAQWQLIKNTLSKLEQDDFLLLKKEGKFIFSLLPLKGFELEVLGSSPIDALNTYFRYFTRHYYLQHEKAEAQKLIKAEIKKGENYCKKTSQKLDQLKTGTAPNQLADIIMANMHAIPTGSTSTTLFNFYNNEQVTIPLKKDLSPQKNAERYYRKAKNRKIELETLEKNLAEKEEKLLKLYEQAETVAQTDDLRALRKLIKNEAVIPDKEEIKPYKAFEVDGFKVWVGKNAKSNDQLTLKLSYKEDVWLHAKDCPGSHVLIKHQAGKSIAKHTLERVAEIAAYYSKRKTDSLVPVIYTSAKFVRKRKGSPAGQVVVDKENVLLVVPKGPN